LLQGAVIYFFIRRNKALKAAASKNQVVEGSYEHYRGLALRITPYELKIAIPNSETLVYGVIMDWNMGDAVATLAAYINGAANLYLSSGGNIIGGGSNPSVGEAAVEFITSAQNSLDKALPSDITEVPDKGMVRFYFLTNHKMFAVEEREQNLDNGSSPWIDLFKKGNGIISEMRNGGNGSTPH